ncbi:MAG: hypothetical protein AABZ43_07355 [Planctomycetota bacterium]
MTDTNDLAKFQEDTSSVLAKTLTGLIEGITGVAASEKKEIYLSVGHLLQAVRKGKFLSQFLTEWNQYRAKGRIKEDYPNTEQHYTCIQEILDFLDSDPPEEIRFDILKKIFLVAATEKVSDRKSLLPQQYMKVCRTLSSGEIVVLSTAYKISKQEYIKHNSAAVWLKKIAEESGLVHPELVEIHEEELMKKHLLSPRVHSDKSAINVNPHFRLTRLGLDICNYIENYVEEKEV